jgi:hypothetical protein
MTSTPANLTETPLEAISLDEVRCFLAVTPCPHCHAGPLTLDSPPNASVTCNTCQAALTIDYTVEYPLPDAPDDAIPYINPTDEPSQLVDLNQWLGLAYLHTEAAQNHRIASSEHHMHQLWAAACFTEALKFYPKDNEFPPQDACWVETSRRALADHPNTFSREMLMGMRTKLPPLPAWPV